MPQSFRYTLPVLPDRVDEEAARLWAAGALGVWERSNDLVAWFADDDAAVPDGGAWDQEPDRDWQAEWKATIRPVRAGGFLIVPSWLADRVAADDPATVLVLDPGRAFGSGHHATTTMCLELLDTLELNGRTLADIGCGTGVLAIAAARRGAAAVAVDIDPDAVEVAGDNATRNHVTVDVRGGSMEVLDGPADVVVANLATDTIVALAEDLASLTGDVLVVSGISTERRRRAVDALHAAGLATARQLERNGWVALVARRTDEDPT